MRILSIEENIKTLSMGESIQNLAVLKNKIRSSLERGDAPHVNEFELSLLLDKERDQLHKWISLFTDYSYLKKYLDMSLNEVIFHDHKTVSVKGVLNELLNNTSVISIKDFELMAEWLARSHQKDFNYKNPFVSFNSTIDKLKLRITLSHKSINTNQEHKIFIRIFNKPKLDFSNFINEIDILENMITSKKNILFVGATGSGKTSLMQAALRYISIDEHIITIEDTHEIKPYHENTTQLISRKNVSLDDLLSFSLRMTPERIVLGEIRSHEVITAILAMNTGHKGLMTSLHANSALDAFHRLALLFILYSQNSAMSYEDILKMIVTNIDYVVFLNNKKVFEILSPLGVERRDIYYDKIFSLE